MEKFTVTLKRKTTNSSITVCVFGESADEAAFVAENELGKPWVAYRVTEGHLIQD